MHPDDNQQLADWLQEDRAQWLREHAQPDPKDLLITVNEEATPMLTSSDIGDAIDRLVERYYRLLQIDDEALIDDAENDMLRTANMLAGMLADTTITTKHAVIL